LDSVNRIILASAKIPGLFVFLFQRNGKDVANGALMAQWRRYREKSRRCPTVKCWCRDGNTQKMYLGGRK
jgi:hypothetical protein